MERRPVQLVVDIIPLKENLQLIIEGGTITNISSVKQQLQLTNVPSHSVGVKFVHDKDRTSFVANKPEVSDEEDEEEEHDQHTRVEKPKHSILEQCLRNQLALSAANDKQVKSHQIQTKSSDKSGSRLAALIASSNVTSVPDGLSAVMNGHINKNLTVPTSVSAMDTPSLKKEMPSQMNQDPAKKIIPELPSPSTDITQPPAKKISQEDMDCNNVKTSTEIDAPEQVPVVESTQPNIPQLDSEVTQSEQNVEEKPETNSTEEEKTEEEKVTPKRKRGRPFRKDHTDENRDIPAKKPKTETNVRTRSRSRPVEESNNKPEPVTTEENNMTQFVQKELVENSLPEFVCQLCGFRLDQERYVQKHVKLRHADVYHGSNIDKSSQEQKPTNKEEVEAFTNARRQGHYTRNRNRKSTGSNGDTFEENENAGFKTPDSKTKEKAKEKESPSLSRTNECSLCGKDFPSRQSFTHHVETVHNIAMESRFPFFTCNKCQIEFNQLTSYENHMLNVHKESDKLSCTVDGCEAKVNTPGGLKRHIARKHGHLSPSKEPAKKNETETENEEKVKSNSILVEKTNEKTNAIEKQMENGEDKQNESVADDKVEAEARPRSRPECKTCGKKFISNLNLIRHQESCKSEVQIPPPQPERMSKSPVMIRDNNNTITKLPKLHMETTDDLAIKNPHVQLEDIRLSPNLNAQISLRKSVELDPSKLNKAPPPLDIIPMRPEDIVRGMAPVSSPLGFNQMNSHTPSPKVTPRMTSPKPSSPNTPKLQCSKCSFKFISMVNLLRHEKFAHTSSEEKCPYPDCGKVYDSPMSLKCHVGRMHAEKNHPCEQCNKCFGTINSLRSHIKTVHQKIKDLVCPWKDCGKTFGRTSHLENHMKRHRGEMNFGCQYCDYKCIQRASLNYHMRHSHPNDHYSREHTKIRWPKTTESPSHSQSPGAMSSPGPMSPIVSPPTTSMPPVAAISADEMPMMAVSSSNVSFDNM